MVATQLCTSFELFDSPTPSGAGKTTVYITAPSRESANSTVPQEIISCPNLAGDLDV